MYRQLWSFTKKNSAKQLFCESTQLRKKWKCDDLKVFLLYFHCWNCETDIPTFISELLSVKRQRNLFLCVPLWIENVSIWRYSKGSVGNCDFMFEFFFAIFHKRVWYPQGIWRIKYVMSTCLDEGVRRERKVIYLNEVLTYDIFR